MVAHFRMLFRAMSLLLVACLLVGATPNAKPIAIIASVKGHAEVTVAKGGTTTAAGFGEALERGDRIVVGPGSAVTVLFNDGNVVELAEKSAMTVDGRTGAKPKPDAPGVSGEVYAGVSQFVAGGSRETGLVALSTLRSGPDSSPLLLSPRNTELLDGHPSFSWRAVEGATRYRVSVSGDAGELWNREVTGTALAYPADATVLATGGDYLWEVRALSDRSELRREETSVRVLPDEDAAGVRASLSSIAERTGGAESEAAHFLAGCYLFSRGLLNEAGHQFEALVRLAPEARAPHESLGNVYRAVGLMDLAAAEYQRALAADRGR